MFNNFIVFIILALLILLFVFMKQNPLKALLKLIINCIVGFCFIFVSNYILKNVGVFVGINLFTILFTSILGIPGLMSLYIIKIML